MALANVEALADEPEITDPDCPNGCLAKEGKGCWCHGSYPNLQEYNWNKPQKEIGQ